MSEGSYAGHARNERILALEAQIAALQSELAQLQAPPPPETPSEPQSDIDRLPPDSPTRIVIPGLQQAGLILQSIIGQSLIGLEIIQDGLPVFTNQALADMRGYSLEEIRSFSHEEYWNLVHPDQRDEVYQRHLERVRGAETPSRYEFKAIRKDGTECWFEIFATPIDFLGKPATLSLLVDATERKQAANRLLDREQRLTALFEHSLDAIVVMDNHGRIVEANPAAAELFGRSKDDVMGQRPVVFAQRKDQQEFERIFGEFLDEGTRQDVMKIKRPDGAIRHAEYLAKANYVPGLHVAFMRDVTPRIEAEVARIESERAFKSLAENIPDLITRVDKNLNYTYVNPAMARHFEFSAEEMIGVSSIIGPPDLPITQRWAEARRKVINTGKPDSLSFSMDLPDGMHHFHALLVPEFDEEGNVETVLSVNREVTEAKMAEIRIRENEAFIRDVTDNVPYMILVYSTLTNDVVLANQTFREFMKQPQNQADTISRATIRDSIHPEDMLLLEQVAREITTDPSEKFINTEIRLRNPAGEWRWMKLWISAFRRASDGSVEQYMGIAQDVTEQRQSQTQALRLALEEERVRVLTDFIQAASHEFRTPLSSINTSLYMLERLVDDESASRYLSRIEAGADQILMLVEALLHLSELDGIQQLELTPLQVTTLAEHVIERYEPVAAERNITLTRHAEDHLPDAAINARQFTSALAHLVDNAIRYTPDDGTVEIRVTADHTSVQIAIIDNGIGMSPEVQSQIFQRFFRLDTARSTRGLGLGLPSVEKIVQLHGGTVSVESAPGKGSTFTIILPALTQQTENAFSNLDTRM